MSTSLHYNHRKVAFGVFSTWHILLPVLVCKDFIILIEVGSFVDFSYVKLIFIGSIITEQIGLMSLSEMQTYNGCRVSMECI